MSLTGEAADAGLRNADNLRSRGDDPYVQLGANDTYRAAGDAAFGTILDITFMYLMVLPCVYYTGMVRSSAFLIVFACCYIDEPIRFCLMQRHMYSLKWIKPVTPQGQAALAEFNLNRKKKR